MRRQSLYLEDIFNGIKVAVTNIITTISSSSIDHEKITINEQIEWNQFIECILHFLSSLQHYNIDGVLKTWRLYDSNNDHKFNHDVDGDEGGDGDGGGNGGKTSSKWCDEYEMEVCRKQSIIL